MRIEHHTTIHASVERVWRLTQDVERWPMLMSTVTSVQRLDAGELRVGSQARIVQPLQRPRIWTVSRIEAPHHFVWGAKMGPIQMTGSHIIEPAPEGARNTLVLELSGFGSRLLGSLVARQLASTLRIENEGFKRAAEAATTAAP